jgi:hypothetical protein
MLNLARAHQSHLEQLTGCRYGALRHLAAQLAPALRQARGRPYRHGALSMLVLGLMKLRLSLSVRALEALTGVDAVTLSRFRAQGHADARRAALESQAAGLLARGCDQRPCGQPRPRQLQRA